MITVSVKINRKTKGGGIGTILDRFAAAVQEGEGHAAEETRKIAARLAPGPAKNAIKVEFVDTSNMEVITYRIFNDTKEVPWSSYTEFGTGLYVDNEGVKEAIRLKRAKEIPWLVPAWKVAEDFKIYHYPLITGADGKQYWVVEGMHPHPYMQPAAFQNREKNIEAVMDAIRSMVREVVT